MVGVLSESERQSCSRDVREGRYQEKVDKVFVPDAFHVIVPFPFLIFARYSLRARWFDESSQR
jgi:hypothetical protein